MRDSVTTVLEQLQRDAIDIIDGNVYSVYQYNPPYTLPWLRRNELAIPVFYRKLYDVVPHY